MTGDDGRDGTNGGCSPRTVPVAAGNGGAGRIRAHAAAWPVARRGVLSGCAAPRAGAVDAGETGAGGPAAQQGMDGGDRPGRAGVAAFSAAVCGLAVDSRAGGGWQSRVSGRSGAAFPTSGEPYERTERRTARMAGVVLPSSCEKGDARAAGMARRTPDRTRGTVDSGTRTFARGAGGSRLDRRGGACPRGDGGLRKIRRGVQFSETNRGGGGFPPTDASNL